MRESSIAPPFSKALLGSALAAAAMLSGCSGGESPTPSAGTAVTEQAAARQAAALQGLDEQELGKRASRAMREQRLYAPAGDNAMEYYIALRSKSAKPDASAESALADLMPYAVIAAEQAIGRADWIEAERLRALIERADPQAPALPRIAEAIAKGRTGSEQGAELAEQQARIAEENKLKAAADAKLKAAQQAAAERAAAASAVVAAPVAAPVPPREPEPQPVPPPATVAAPPAAPPPAPVAASVVPAPRNSTPVPVSTPQPSYPPDAQRAGKTGEVVASFTINADGSVGDVRIVSSKPRGVFDRNVQSAVRRWRFQAMDKPQTVTRTFSFTL